MRFVDYLFHKRRMEAGYRLKLKFMLEDPQEGCVVRHGSLEAAVLHHTKDFIEAKEKLQRELEASR